MHIDAAGNDDLPPRIERLDVHRWRNPADPLDAPRLNEHVSDASAVLDDHRRTNKTEPSRHLSPI
ncbi:hypothetical protein [Micromonospora sp. HUAS LYJ1]|uniref:hypothetical protein n=1 Tax=Micromonospora sp. HUAS LYJ1 TaxID=3061626 RepID=UPI0026736B53|nr:hypothetical protein [Micromonospora sp. HUAS LYJ1]WKU05406.1 hypothetical protein Q2K16_32495 [Micromonospora sp. HUAS LYJ1]